MTLATFLKDVGNCTYHINDGDMLTIRADMKRVARMGIMTN
jgi:hypothetical protein